MPRVEFTNVALSQLRQLIAAYELPANTPRRVAASIDHLTEFPDAGSPLSGEWEGFRFVLGPWPWMLVIYALVGDVVAVVTIEDSRRAAAATAVRTGD